MTQCARAKRYPTWPNERARKDDTKITSSYVCMAMDGRAATTIVMHVRPYVLERKMHGNLE